MPALVALGTSEPLVFRQCSSRALRPALAALARARARGPSFSPPVVLPVDRPPLFSTCSARGPGSRTPRGSLLAGTSNPFVALPSRSSARGACPSSCPALCVCAAAMVACASSDPPVQVRRGRELQGTICCRRGAGTAEALAAWCRHGGGPVCRRVQAAGGCRLPVGAGCRRVQASGGCRLPVGAGPAGAGPVWRPRRGGGTGAGTGGRR